MSTDVEAYTKEADRSEVWDVLLLPENLVILRSWLIHRRSAIASRLLIYEAALSVL
jgi:hypothetical protein